MGWSEIVRTWGTSSEERERRLALSVAVDLDLGLRKSCT